MSWWEDAEDARAAAGDWHDAHLTPEPWCGQCRVEQADVGENR